MSGPIPQAFVDELIQRVDIVELVNSRVRLKKRGREHIACCPFHQEKTPSFTVSSAKQFYHCFGCGAHGTAIGFLMAHERLSFPEAVTVLAEWAGLPVPESSEADRKQSEHRQRLIKVCARADQLFQAQLRGDQAAIKYLKKRGLSGEIAAKFGIGYAPGGWDFLIKQLADEKPGLLTEAGLVIERENKKYDRFRQRVMFPIHNIKGDVIGFGGRSLGDQEPKYLNSPETPLFHKGRELYGLHWARRSAADHLILVEGYMDAIALAQAGIDNVVATLGTALTVDHVRRAWRYFDNLILCFDGDNAGRRAAWRSVETVLPELRPGRQIRFLFLPEGQDPDSLVRQEGAKVFGARLGEAQPLSEVFHRQLRLQSQSDNESSVEGRAKLVEQARPLLAQVRDPVYREMLTAEIAKYANISPQLIETNKQSIKSWRDKSATTSNVTPFRKPGRAAHGRGTLIRQAVTLILHHPSACLEVENWEPLSTVPWAGIDLLMQLITTSVEQFTVTQSSSKEAVDGNATVGATARLLERFRNHQDYRYLERLAGVENLIEDGGVGVELNSIIARILEQYQRKTRANALIEKARENPISDHEKLELQGLLTALRAE
ncbi:MAG: DNA primase [Gammaproteobacteria bacterium]|nr:DNA primase [Gammaproteobacteria bacterium]